MEKTTKLSRVRFLPFGAAAGVLMELLSLLQRGSLSLFSFAAGYLGLWAVIAMLIAARRRSPAETLRDIALFLAGMTVIYYLAEAVGDCIDSRRALSRPGGEAGLKDWLCLPDVGGMALWCIGALLFGAWGYLIMRYRRNILAWTVLSLVPLGVAFSEGLSLFVRFCRDGVGLIPMLADLGGGLLCVRLLFKREKKPEDAPEEPEQPEDEEEMHIPDEEEKWLL